LRIWLTPACLLSSTRVAITSETRRPCPQPCHCNPTLLEVNCSDSRVTTVPEGLPVDTKLLNLTHNKMKTLAHQQFHTLTQLLELDLSDNVMAAIEVEAFLGLQSLLTLRLARNRLMIIPTGALAGLPKLKLLDISSNEILVFLDFTFRDLPALQFMKAAGNDLVFISQQAFAGLSSLQELYLDGCNLTAVPTEALFGLNLTSLTIRHSRLNLHLLGGSLLRIEIGAFRGLTHFKSLNVSRNLLDTLEVGAFHSVDTLKTLGIDNNPLACDCRLLWLVRRRPHLDFGGSPPTCTTSVQLQGWSFLDFTEAEIPGLLTYLRFIYWICSFVFFKEQSEYYTYISLNIRNNYYQPQMHVIFTLFDYVCYACILILAHLLLFTFIDVWNYFLKFPIKRFIF
uniref:LRRNT domain-containing protein n=1 Tax=Mola mola TaxID=94237 RepID=A0A3Q4BRQ9_MOLML